MSADALPRGGSPRALALLRKSLPVLIAVVVLVAIFRRYSVADVGAAMREGNTLATAPFVVLLAVFYITWGALCDTLVLRVLFGARFLDVARGKAAMAVLTSVGYVFSTGGYGVWLARVFGTSVLLSGSLLVYFMAADLAAVGAWASAVLPLAEKPVPTLLRVVAWGMAAAPVLAILLVPQRPPSAEGPHDALAPWRVVPRRVGLLQLAGRCVNIGMAVATTSLGARAFGLQIPLVALVTYLPVLLLLASLPINVGGVGAVQGAWLLFFLPWESGPKILAFNFVWTAMMGAAILLRGLPFLRRALAQIAAAPRSPATTVSSATVSSATVSSATVSHGTLSPTVEGDSPARPPSG